MTVVINGTTGIDTGTGSLIAADATTPTYLDLFEDTDNGSNYVRLIAPTSVASNRTLTLPDATGTVVVGSAAVSAIGQIPFSTDGSTYTPTAKIVSGTAITLTNQTAPEFTGIPSWAKRITLTFSGVSTNGTASPLVQIGSGTYATSGYLGANSVIAASSVGTIVVTTGFGIGGGVGSWAAAQVVNGAITLSLHNGNTWVCSGSVGTSAGTGIYLTSGSSGTAISGVLDRVRLFIDGTQQFDAGTINILYE